MPKQGLEDPMQPHQGRVQRFRRSIPHKALKMLGVKGQQNRRAIRNITDAAEASQWLWIKQGGLWATHAT